MGKNMAIVTYLFDNILEKGDLNINDFDIAYAAAYLGRLDVLELGFNFYGRVINGETLIFGAARGGQLETIKYLVRHGLDIDSKDDQDNTALHIFPKYPLIFSTCSLLVELGIDLNVQNLNLYTALNIAVKQGNFDLMKLLVDAGANLNLKNKLDFTALYEIVLAINSFQSPVDSAHNLNMIKYLIENGADADIKTKSGSTALHLAVSKHRLDVVTLLMKSTSDVNIRDKFGKTALHIAASRGDTDIIKFLIRNGADTNIRDGNGNTVMHNLTISKNQTELKFIAEKGGDVNVRNNNGRTALHLAAEGDISDKAGSDIKREPLDIVILLVELGVDVNIRDNKGNTALHLAIKRGHLKTVKYLVERGSDLTIIDNYGNTSLHLAASTRLFEDDMNIGTGQVDIIKKGTRENAKKFKAIEEKRCLNIFKIIFVRCKELVNFKNRTGNTALHEATSKGHLEIVELLLKHNANVDIKNNSGRTALQLAGEDDKHIMKLLIEHGADVNNRDRDGWTILHEAASEGHLDFIKFLITECNGIVNNIDNSGCTAIHRATYQNHIDTVNFLGNYGINVDFKDNGGRTALHLAAEKGLSDIAICLVEFGANVNIQDNAGNTALHLAISRGHIKTVKYLVEIDSDLTITDNYGSTLLHLAAKGCIPRIDKPWLFENEIDIKNKCMDNYARQDLNILEDGLDDVVKWLTGGNEVSDSDNDDTDTNRNDNIVNEENFDIFQFVDSEFNNTYNNDDFEKITRKIKIIEKKRYLDIFKILIEKCTEVVNIKDSTKFTALHIATLTGRLEIVELLLKHNACVDIKDKCNRTALQLAAEGDELDIIRLLVEHAADVNNQDTEGWTILHKAASEGHLDIIKFLVTECNANVNNIDNEDCTVIHRATYQNHIETVNFLGNCGIDVCITDKDGYTALHVAAKMGQLDIVILLVEFGVNVNVKDNEGNTALHLAISRGHLKTVKYLVERGSDLTIIDSYGSTLLHLAAKGCIPRIDKPWLFKDDIGSKSKNSNEYASQELVIFKNELDMAKSDTGGNEISDSEKIDTGINRSNNTANEDIFDIFKFVKNYFDYIYDDNFEEIANRVIIIENKRFTEIFKVLIDRSSEVINNEDENTFTALHLATLTGRLEIVELLLKHNACVDIKDKCNRTALQLAAKYGKLDIIRLLVEHAADVNNPDMDGWTALHAAASEGHLDIIKFLVTECDANVNNKDKEGCTAIDRATSHNHIEIVNFLGNCGIDVSTTDNRGRTALHLAAEKGQLDITIRLVEFGANVNIQDNGGSTALHLAISRGHFKIIEYLIESRTDLTIIDNYGNTPLHLAAKGRDPSIVQSWIFDDDMDTVKWGTSGNEVSDSEDVDTYINRNDNTVNNYNFDLNYFGNFFHKLNNDQVSRKVENLEKKRSLDIAKLLVEKCSKIINIQDETGYTAMHLATLKGNLEIVELLLKHNACVDIKDKCNRTALQLAAKHGKLDIIRLLVEHAADVNNPDMDGWTALHAATSEGHLDIIKFLVTECDANVNNIDKNGCTALHIATNHNRIEIVKFLDNCGIDFGIIDNNGRTALHLAAEGGMLDIVSLLVEYRTDVNIRDNGGSTALHLAISRGHLKTVEYLVENGTYFTVVDNHGRTPLHLAARGCDPGISLLWVLEDLMGSNSKYNYAEQYSVNPEDGLDILKSGTENKEVSDSHIISKYDNVSHIAQLCHFDNMMDIKNKDCAEQHPVNPEEGLNILKSGTDDEEISDLDIISEDDNVSHIAQLWLLDDMMDVKNKDCAEQHSVNLEEGLDILKSGTHGEEVSNSNIISEDDNISHIAQLCLFDDMMDIKNKDCAEQHSVNHLEEGLDIFKSNIEGEEISDLDIIPSSEDVNTNTDITNNIVNNDISEIAKIPESPFSYNHNDNRVASIPADPEKERYLIIAKLLVEKCSEVINIQDETGYTAMHLATLKGNLKIVELLLKHNACVDIKDKCNRTALQLAAKHGKLDIIRLLVEHAADVKNPDIDGWTALHAAASEGHLDIIKFLVTECDANVNNIDKNGCTALHIATYYNHRETVKFLDNCGIDVGITDNNGRTALHLAAKGGRLDIVSLLVEFRTDVNIRDNGGSTALHLATSRGYLKIVEYLVENGTYSTVVDNHGHTPLHLAARGCDSSISLLWILEDIMGSNSKYNYAEQYSVNPEDELDILKSGTEDKEVSDSHIISKDDNVSHIAQLCHFDNMMDIKNKDCAEQHPVNPEEGLDIKSGTEDKEVSDSHIISKDDNASHIAQLCLFDNMMDIKNKDCAEQHPVNPEEGLDILKSGTEGEEVSDSHIISEDDNISHIAQLCLFDNMMDIKNKDCVEQHSVNPEEGLDILKSGTEGEQVTNNVVNNDTFEIVKIRESPFSYNHNANRVASIPADPAKERYLNIAKLLVENCSEGINIQDETGCTAMHLATLKGNLEIVKLLLKHNADVDVKDKCDRTALQLAAKDGRLDITKLLVEHGADVNSRNDEGHTALQAAARKRQFDVVNSLIECGTDLSNNNDPTTLHLAAERGEFNIVIFLAELGIDVDVKDNQGNTALQLALDNGHMGIAKYLVEIGADSKNDNRDTVLQYAVQKDL